MWHLMRYIAQQIRVLGGEDVYKQYGQQMIDSIKANCTENFGTEITRYPEDEEIVEVINAYRNLNGGKINE